MLINLIWLVGLAVDQPWEISQTGIFTPLDQNGYAVSGSFRFYLMDAKERCIRLFDSEGRFVKTIGGRGKLALQIPKVGVLASPPDPKVGVLASLLASHEDG